MKTPAKTEAGVSPLPPGPPVGRARRPRFTDMQPMLDELAKLRDVVSATDTALAVLETMMRVNGLEAGASKAAEMRGWCRAVLTPSVSLTGRTIQPQK